jgi:hypothetical protein
MKTGVDMDKTKPDMNKIQHSSEDINYTNANQVRNIDPRAAQNFTTIKESNEDTHYINQNETNRNVNNSKLFEDRTSAINVNSYLI